jgi:hypothetical protein
MTDLVAASMGLAFQDGSPKLLTRRGAEPELVRRTVRSVCSWINLVDQLGWIIHSGPGSTVTSRGRKRQAGLRRRRRLMVPILVSMSLPSNEWSFRGI